VNKWIGQVFAMIDGHSVYKVRIIDFDGVWFWAVRA
jgi:hypothetical protein